MRRSFAMYRALGHRTVQGWVERPTLDVLRTLRDAQDDAGVQGTVAEIGVHHGKLFIGLQLLNTPGIPAVAVDVFADQDRNVDDSGRGDLSRFESNVRRWGDWSRVVVRQTDSILLTGADVRDVAGPVRLFSVDGGHTEELVIADMRTAEQALAPGGIIVADDVFNAEWPGVAVGTVRFLDAGASVVPFAIGFNKVYFADAEHAPAYRASLRQGFADRWRLAHKITTFHQHEVDVLWSTPLTPRSVLRRSRLARQAYESIRAH